MRRNEQFRDEIVVSVRKGCEQEHTFRRRNASVFELLLWTVCKNYNVSKSGFPSFFMLKQYEDFLTLFDAEVESLAYFEPSSPAEINNAPLCTAMSYIFYNVVLRHRC